MNSFMHMIRAWPSDQSFADDIGTSVALVRVWKHRNSIPPRYWRQIIVQAKKRGISLSESNLIDFATPTDSPEGSNDHAK